MEQRGAVAAKKVWSMLRALYFMLRKGKSKNLKYMFDLSMMIKRGKLAAGKALYNHKFPDQHKDANVDRNYLSSSVLPGEYVFSCSNTPLFRTRNGSSSSFRFLLCAQALHTKEEEDVVTVNIIAAMHEGVADATKRCGLAPSPALSGPIGDQVHQEDSHVDKAAEEFIIKFYQDLKKQNMVTSS